jgi:hypothetical protein
MLEGRSISDSGPQDAPLIEKPIVRVPWYEAAFHLGYAIFYLLVIRGELSSFEIQLER